QSFSTLTTHVLPTVVNETLNGTEIRTSFFKKCRNSFGRFGPFLGHYHVFSLFIELFIKTDLPCLLTEVFNSSQRILWSRSQPSRDIQGSVMDLCFGNDSVDCP